MLEYIKSQLSVERKKLKDMTFKEKAAYIWEYYKIHIIVTAVILLIAGSIIDSVWIHPPKKLYLQIAFYGGYVEDTALTGMCGKLEEVLMTPEERETMQITSTYFMIGTNDPQVDMANMQKFMAMIQVNEIDLIVLNEENFESMAFDSLFLPLADILPESLLSRLSDKLVFKADESGVNAARAIRLDGNDFFTENDIFVDGQYLAVITNTIRAEDAGRAIEYIINS